jgi:hypothetical protein
VRVTGEIELFGPVPDDIDLTVKTDIRYWLAGAGLLDPWLVQLTNVTAGTTTATTANDTTASGGAVRHLQAGNTGGTSVVVTVAMATRRADLYQNGAEGAQAAATAAITGINAAIGTFALPSLPSPVTNTLFRNFVITTVASDCPLGQGKVLTSDDGISACAICPVGTYSSGMTRCQNCPEGGNCARVGTAVPDANAGWWRAPQAVAQQSFDFNAFPYHKCLTTDMCLGGALSACPTGHVYGEPLCGVCEDGYSGDVQGGVCANCPKKSTVVTRFALLAGFLLLAAALLLARFLYTPHLTIAQAVALEPTLATAVPALHKGASKNRRGSATFLMPTHTTAATVAVRNADKVDELQATGHTTVPIKHNSMSSNSYSYASDVPSSSAMTGDSGASGSVLRVASSTASAYYDDSGTLSPVTPYAAGAMSGGVNSRADSGLEMGPINGQPNGQLNGQQNAVGQQQQHHRSGPVAGDSGSVAQPSTLGSSSSTDDDNDNDSNMNSDIGDLETSEANEYDDESTVTPLVLTPRTVYKTNSKLTLRRQLKAKALILISFLHTISSLGFGAAYWIRWPSNFAGFLASLKVIDLAVLTIPNLSLKCITPELNFYDEWLLAVLSLPAIAALLTVLWLLGRVIIKFSEKRDSSTSGISETRSLQRLRFDAKFVQAFIWVTIAVYPGVSRRVLQLFHCMKLDNITNDQWNDLSLSCNGDTYGSYLGANVIALLVYPIGVPLALGAMLYRYKVKPLSDVDRAAWSLRVGFLTDTYKQKFWYWEVLDLGRRLLLTGIVIFIAPATIGQLCGGALFSFFFFKVHCYFRPYATVGHNFLQGAAQAVLTLCLLCGLLAQAGVSGARDDAGVGAVSLALCILFLAVLLPLSLLNELPRVQAVLRDKLEAIGVYKVEAHDGANSFKRHLPLKTPTINSAFAYTPNAAASAAAATAAANYRSNVLKTQGGAKSSSSDSTSRGGTTTDVLSSSPTWKWEGGNGTTDDNTTDTNNTISTDDNSSIKGKSVNTVRSKSSGRGARVTDSAAAAALARAHSRAGSSSDTNNKQNNNANSSSSKQAGLTLAHFLAMADNTEIPKADAADTAGGGSGSHHHAADSSARSGDGSTGDLMGLSANGAEMILNALRSSTDKGAEITPQVGRNGDWIFPGGRGDPNGSFNSMLDSSVNDIDDSVSSVGGVSNLYPTRDHHAAGASVDGDSTIGSEVEIADWRKTVSSTAAQTAAEAARDARMRGLQLQAAAQQQQQQKYRRGYGSAIPCSADISGSGARNNSSSSIRANRNSGTARNSGTRSSRGSRTQQQQQDDTEAGFNYDTMGSFVFRYAVYIHTYIVYIEHDALQ